MAIGFGGQDKSVRASCSDADGTIPATSAALWTFSSAVKKALIQNHPSSGAKLYVLFNADAAGDVAPTTDWDVVLSAGDYVTAPDGLLIKTVGIYTDVEITDRTDVQVRGWV